MTIFDNMNSFLSRIPVHPSSNKYPKEMRYALWGYLNTYVYNAYFDSTEYSSIRPLKNKSRLSSSGYLQPDLSLVHVH